MRATAQAIFFMVFKLSIVIFFSIWERGLFLTYHVMLRNLSTLFYPFCHATTVYSIGLIGSSVQLAFTETVETLMYAILNLNFSQWIKPTQ